MVEKVGKLKKAAKAHTAYYNAAGVRVPGTTTITGVMDKPALMYWSNSLGLEGINVRDYVDSLAKVGTCGHYMAECFLKKEVPNLRDFTANQIELAKVCYEKFLTWFHLNDFSPTLIEKDFVSEEYQYGGKIDLYGTSNGERVLIDLKTCKAIYPEHKTQTYGGYCRLLVENGIPVDRVIILRIGRNENEGFEVISSTPEEIKLHDKRFLICRELYDINKQIEGKKKWYKKGGK